MTTQDKMEALEGWPRIRRFLQYPWREKTIWLRRRWARLCHQWINAIPGFPVKLPSGALWVPRKDNMREALLAGTFEAAEIAFVKRFLKAGMTVLDIGAHHGIYTLLASKSVGPKGKVIAFEPSPRERRALRLHLGLNCCKNVLVEGFALGDEENTSDLYVVERWAAGCNSLTPPDVPATTSRVRVRVVRLDDWLTVRHIARVDFVKMDVEGAELAVLRGAGHLLQNKPRPVILAEIQDVRTRPWGYAAKQIIEYLHVMEYRWFCLSREGFLIDLDVSTDSFEGNYVACPAESVTNLQKLACASE